MDYIFNDWEKKLSNFADSVEKDLNEIRQCKAEIQQMKLEMEVERKRGRYVRDDHRLVLSAPEIVIGNVDRNGTLFPGGSTIVVRGTDVGVQAAGEGGQLEMRAAGIRQIAEDPGVDGYEHVVYNHSEVVSQARNIIIQSDETTGAFFAPTLPTGGSGVRIHADQKVDIEAAMTAESREKQLDDITKDAEDMKKVLKEQADQQKSGLKKSIEEIIKLIEKKEKLAEDYTAVRTNAADIQGLDRQLRELSSSIANCIYDYSEVLSQLAEANRQAKSFKAQKETIVKGEDFKKNATGAAVAITGERISLVSADGEGNLRDNEGSGIAMKANKVDIASVEEDGKLKEKGQVSITAKNIDMTTAGETGQEYEEGELKTAAYTAEGDFTLRSKNITIEAVDYEMAEKKRKEKQLTAESTIKLRAKTIEVSTEGSKDIEVDEEGKLTKASYTAEGDIIVRSKTLSVESIDHDVENGQATEKALTAGSTVSIRAEKTDLAATDTEGKATGSVNINAKDVSVKSMDVDKEKRTDSNLAEGSTMTLVSETLYIGAQSDDVKSKLVQAQSEEITLAADKTLKAQQDKEKALLQLADGKSTLKSDANTINGNTTLSDNAEVKGEIKSPKATIDHIKANSSLNSPNISDGMAV
ncbi:MAG: hypothetical protein IJQ60_03590 [Prevotella sp.]|nr:hypothetical protein [Prevotella sp.]